MINQIYFVKIVLSIPLLKNKVNKVNKIDKGINKN
jgi:hypothetical protein